MISVPHFGNMVVAWVGWEQGFFMGMRPWGYVGPWCCRGLSLCEEFRIENGRRVVYPVADRSYVWSG